MDGLDYHDSLPTNGGEAESIITVATILAATTTTTRVSGEGEGNETFLPNSVCMIYGHDDAEWEYIWRLSTKTLNKLAHIVHGNGSKKIGKVIAMIKEQFAGQSKDWLIVEGIGLLVKRASAPTVEAVADVEGHQAQWTAVRTLAAKHKVGFTRSYKKLLLKQQKANGKRSPRGSEIGADNLHNIDDISLEDTEWTHAVHEHNVTHIALGGVRLSKSLLPFDIEEASQELKAIQTEVNKLGDQEWIAKVGPTALVFIGESAAEVTAKLDSHCNGEIVERFITIKQKDSSKKVKAWICQCAHSDDADRQARCNLAIHVNTSDEINIQPNLQSTVYSLKVIQSLCEESVWKSAETAVAQAQLNADKNKKAKVSSIHPSDVFKGIITAVSTVPVQDVWSYRPAWGEGQMRRITALLRIDSKYCQKLEDASGVGGIVVEEYFEKSQKPAAKANRETVWAPGVPYKDAKAVYNAIMAAAKSSEHTHGMVATSKSMGLVVDVDHAGPIRKAIRGSEDAPYHLTWKVINLPMCAAIDNVAYLLFGDQWEIDVVVVRTQKTSKMAIVKSRGPLLQC